MASCATGPALAPRAAFPIDRDIDELHGAFASATSIRDYYTQGETSARRNAFIAGRLALYDLEYIRFIAHLRLGRAQQAVAFDGAALSVGFATTFAGGAHTKAILGALTTALTGARTSYEKNFYDDKTTAALVTQMTAERKLALIPILAGAKADIGDYPLTSAIANLTAYQYAGTLDGALASVQRDAAVKDAKATQLLDQYRIVPYAPDDSTLRLQKWIWPGAVSFAADGTVRDAGGTIVEPDAAHVQALRDRLDAMGLRGLPLSQFFGAAPLAAARAAAIKDLGIP